MLSGCLLGILEGYWIHEIISCVGTSLALGICRGHLEGFTS